jgi:hypothetical protein
LPKFDDAALPLETNAYMAASESGASTDREIVHNGELRSSAVMNNGGNGQKEMKFLGAIDEMDRQRIHVRFN